MSRDHQVMLTNP